MLEGKLVRLRAMEEKDLPFFHKWMNDPEITQYLLKYLPFSLKDEQEWFDKARNDPSRVHFAIEDRKSGKTIGHCALVHIHPANRNAEFAISIGEKTRWNKGAGTEAARLLFSYAFDTLNLHRINSGAADFNPRSIRMHEKLGFKKEGLQRERLYRRGKYCGLIGFGLLRDEFKR